MTAIRIHYIATKEKALTTFKDYCSRQHIVLVKYDIKKTESVPYLMILEPLQIGNQQYALSKIWKRWFFNHTGNTRLFVAGYAKSKHPNFLNLLDLPAALRPWLEALHPVGAFTLQYAGTETLPNGLKLDKYTDPWDRFLPVRGIDMIKQLTRFLDGHDEHYSINNQLSRIRKELIDIKNSLEVYPPPDNDPHLEEKRKKMQEEWVYLQNRWQFYNPLFELLPFHDTAAAIRKCLEVDGEISLFFKKEISQAYSLAPLNKTCNTIDSLIGKVKNTIDRHVYPENYW